MKRLQLWLVLVIVGLASGCATFDRMAAPPELKQEINIVMSNDTPGMNDMPIGVYRLPESSTYISGHQRGHAAGMMFGLLGVAITHGINEARAKERMEAVERHLKIDMNAETSAAFNAKIKQQNPDGPLAVTSGAAGKTPTLSLMPYVVLTFVSDNLARPYIVLKASLKDASGNDVWWTRYLGAIKDDRPIDGNNGWSADDGKPFKAAVAKLLDTVADVAVRDLSGKLPRSAAKDAKLKTQYAFVQQEFDVPGKLVEHNDQTVVFIPQIGDVIVFAGVNIFSRNLVQISDAPPPKQ